MGRKPIFDAPMTGTERAKRHKAKVKAEKQEESRRWWAERGWMGEKLVDLDAVLAVSQRAKNGRIS